MNCALYARKSNTEAGDKKADRKSVAVQLTECREFAKARGWTVVEEFVDDAVSGAEFENRPEFNRLLDSVVKVKRLPFEGLLVTERSRIARESIDGLAVFKKLLDSGLTMWETAGSGEQISLDNASDKIKEFIKLFSAEEERGRGGERSRRVKAQAAKAGRATGKRLFGYAKDWTIEPLEAEVVRLMYKLRSEGMGLYRICRALERKEIKTPTGKDNWNITTVAQITKNPAYAGTREWGREKRTYKHGHVRIVKADPAMIIKSACPVIIEPLLWAKVQEINQASADATWRDEAGHLRSRPTSKAQFLLNPFLECWLCHGGMHAKKSGQRYRYVCTKRHQRGPLACANKYGMNQEAADVSVIKTFKKALMIEMVTGQLQAAIDSHKARAADPEPLKKEIAKIEKEITNLVKACASGEVPDIAKAIRDRRARLEHLQGTLVGLGVAEKFDLQKFAERMLPVIGEWQKALDKNASTAQQALRKLVPGRLIAERQPDGMWTFSAASGIDFTPLIREMGGTGDAVTALLQEVKVKATRGCNDQFDSSVSGLVPA